MSLDITQCHDLTVPKLSQRPLTSFAVEIAGQETQTEVALDRAQDSGLDGVAARCAMATFKLDLRSDLPGANWARLSRPRRLPAFE